MPRFLVMVRKAVDKRDAGNTSAMNFDDAPAGSRAVARVSPSPPAVSGGKPGLMVHKSPDELIGNPLANRVFRDVRNQEGRRTALLSLPYDGTKEHAAEVSAQLSEHAENMFSWPDEHYNINSKTGTTDENGRPKFVVSPNHAHVAPAGTREARYIFGDLSAAPNQKRIPTQKRIA